MLTLHDVINFTRKSLAILAMLFIGWLVLYFGFKIIVSIKETLYPTPPAPPTVSFGKLSPTIFPPNSITKSFSYTLNTITGGLPSFLDRATVNKISPAEPNLLALKNAESTVKTVGFTADPVQISDTTYAWTNTDDLPKTLKLNVQTKNFSLSSSYLTNQTVLNATNLPDHTQAIETVNHFLTGLQALPDDINDSKTKVSLYAITNGVLSPATSLSTAQIVRVDLFQNDVNGLQIYYPTPSYSTMYLLLASTDTTNPQIVEAHMMHQAIAPDNATYPIKTTQEAFKQLQAGNAYIASYDGDSNQIIIRNITLGYFIGQDPQTYLMPIFIFQGDNNFFAYVSAVKDDWIEKPQ